MEDFDRLALQWDNEPGRLERAKIVAEAIIKEIPDLDRRVALEYGCGTGLLSFNLQPYLHEIWLGDSSTGMLSVVEQKIEKLGIANMRPLRIDLSAGELPSLKLDLIYTLMALHHVNPLGVVLQAFYDLLQPGGWLCIADLVKEDGTFHSPDFTGHHGFETEELAATLRAIGFSDVRSSICYTVSKQDKQYPLFLMSAQKR